MPLFKNVSFKEYFLNIITANAIAGSAPLALPLVASGTGISSTIKYQVNFAQPLTSPGYNYTVPT